jgi:hypothetical protein
VALTDYKIVLWRLPSDILPPAVGAVSVQDIDYASSHPELVSHLSDGWEVVSHTVGGIGDDLLLTLFLRRAVTVPDDLSGD